MEGKRKITQIKIKLHNDGIKWNEKEGLRKQLCNG